MSFDMTMKITKITK